MARIIGQAAETIDGDLVLPAWLTEWIAGAEGDGMAVQVFRFTVADLAVASQDNEVDLMLLRSREIQEGIIIRLVTEVTGGGLASYDVTVGPEGEPLAYTSPPFDCMQTVEHDTGQQYDGPYLESYVNDTQLKLFVHSEGDDLDAATTGEIWVWVKVSRLPEPS